MSLGWQLAYQFLVELIEADVGSHGWWDFSVRSRESVVLILEPSSPALLGRGRVAELRSRLPFPPRPTIRLERACLSTSHERA